MGARPTPVPFNFEKRVDGNADKLKPPVYNRLLHHGRDMIVMAFGGPDTRAGFHDDPLNEWFHQVRTCPDCGTAHPGEGQAPGGLVRCNQPAWFAGLDGSSSSSTTIRCMTRVCPG